MLSIKKRFIQPLTAVYIATGVVVFTGTVGALSLLKPDFNAAQSDTVAFTQDTLPVVTASSSEPSQSSESDDQKPAATTSEKKTSDPEWSAPEKGEDTKSTPAASPQPSVTLQTPADASLGAEVYLTTEPAPTSTPAEDTTEEPKKDEPSLLDGVFSLVDAIL